MRKDFQTLSASFIHGLSDTRGLGSGGKRQQRPNSGCISVTPQSREESQLPLGTAQKTPEQGLSSVQGGWWRFQEPSQRAAAHICLTELTGAIFLLLIYFEPLPTLGPELFICLVPGS